MATEPNVVRSPEPSPDRTRILQAASGVVWTVVFFVSLALATGLLSWALAQLLPGPPRQTLSLAIAATACSMLLPRPPGAAPLAGIGLSASRAAGVSGPLGLALGFTLAAVCIVGPWIAGAVRLEIAPAGSPDAAGLATAGVLLLAILLGSYAEEVSMHGYALQQLARAATPVGAALATGLLFGGLHAWNPAASWVSIVNTCLFGVFFGLIVVRFRSLWPAVGLHLGWNLGLAILGANVSGLRMELTALRATPVGSMLWTGGEYGPEASLVATVAVLGAIIVAWKAPVPVDDSRLIWDDVQSSKGGS